jgi:hypothetical protein
MYKIEAPGNSKTFKTSPLSFLVTQANVKKMSPDFQLIKQKGSGEKISL